jgi:hypothetical protein
MATVAPYNRRRFSQDEWNDFISWVAEKAPEVPGDKTMWERTTKLPPPNGIEPNEWMVFLMTVEVDLARAGLVPDGTRVGQIPRDERHRPQNQAEDLENHMGMPQRPHMSKSPDQPQLSA